MTIVIFGLFDNFQTPVGESAGSIFRYGHGPKLKTQMSFSTFWEYSLVLLKIYYEFVAFSIACTNVNIANDSKEHSFCKSSYEVHLRMTNASNDPNSFSAREAIQF